MPRKNADPEDKKSRIPGKNPGEEIGIFKFLSRSPGFRDFVLGIFSGFSNLPIPTLWILEFPGFFDLAQY